MATIVNRIKAGEIPPHVSAVAEIEKVSRDKIVEDIITGRTVVPLNAAHKSAKPIGIGAGLSTKINANLGTSPDFPELLNELDKLKVAVEAGADTVMDLSIGGDIDKVREAIIKRSPVPVGTVPIYQAMIEAQEKNGSLVDMKADDLFDVIERQAQGGVDFITVHCGITNQSVDSLIKHRRVMDVVSRGGSFIIAWMLKHQRENPLYEDFDRLLEIAAKYDVTLSLGDGMRPGCLADASDSAQIQELLILGGLAKRARAAGVQVMVEGPGHMPVDQIEANVKMEKEICDGAPFYVLGPLVTDIAPGYDHITAAIGGTLAAIAGADYLCYVTPREHLGLPTLADVHEGVMASRIAAHAADVVKGVPGAGEWDLNMAKARKALNWEAQRRLAIDPDRAAKYYSQSGEKKTKTCTMCSEFCAMELVSEFLGSKETPLC